MTLEVFVYPHLRNNNTQTYVKTIPKLTKTKYLHLETTRYNCEINNDDNK